MRIAVSLMVTVLALAVSGCASPRQGKSEKFEKLEKYVLVEAARSDRQWTGIAVSRDGRIFVNYPRWSANVPFSVGELDRDGTVLPYPAMEPNLWEPGVDPATHFVCVQSVVVDADGFLWILDPANPQFKGVVPGGPKLVKVDLSRNRIVQTLRFAEPVITGSSYLNDVRIDTKRRVAYITDSGAAAIVVVDLASGASRRLLANAPSTRSEETLVTIDGKVWRRPDGSLPQVHADGIALDSDGKYLYYHALTAKTLYRIETRWLRDPLLSEQDLSAKVETVGETGPADGMEFGKDGRVYVTALEESAIKVLHPGGKVRLLVRSPELAWPDSLAFGPEGTLYVTTSQIHRGPDPAEPYKIFKVEKE